MEKIKALYCRLVEILSVKGVIIGGVSVCATLTAVIVIVVASSGKDEKNAASLMENDSSYIETTAEETTVSETTVSEETTEETTTEETTTVPETIPIEELTTYVQEEVETEDPRLHRQEQMVVEPEPETPVEPETAPPAVQEVAQVVNGIDVSAWQGKIDWAKVKADGISFAIIRVGGRSTNGALFTDSRYKENIEGALSNGIPIGIYSYSTALTEQEAIEEASLVLGLIREYKITYPVVFDWESYSSDRIANANLSKDQLTSIARTYCSIIANAGYTPMVYGDLNHLIYRYNTSTICDNYKVWLASYPGYNTNGVPQTYAGKRFEVGNSTPSGNYKGVDYSYQMWQYTSQGRVDGISGNVDMDVAFFSFSGTQVPSSALVINVPNTNLTINVGSSVNIMDGVKAYNTAGTDVTTTLKITVYNSAGIEVMQSTAFNTPGTYNVKYYLKDFTGASKTTEARLIVRKKPEITLNKNEFSMLAYTDNESVTDKKMVDELTNAIISNLVKVSDNEGKDITSSAKLEFVGNSYVKDSSGNAVTTIREITSINGTKLVPGEYKVRYSVTDAKGLSNSIDIKVVVYSIKETVLEYSYAVANTFNGNGNTETGTGESETGAGNAETGNTGTGNTGSEAGNSGTGNTGTEDFAVKLANDIVSNIYGQIGNTVFTYEYNENLRDALDNKAMVPGVEYNVKYEISGLDGQKYYMICRIVVMEEETTTEEVSGTGEEETTTERVSENRGETTTGENSGTREEETTT